jgi:hypothetical protein
MFQTFLAMHVAALMMKKGSIDPVQAYLRLVACNGSDLTNYRQKLHLGVAKYPFASSKFLPIPLTNII